MHFVLVVEDLHNAIFFVVFKYARVYKSYCYHGNIDICRKKNLFECSIIVGFNFKNIFKTSMKKRNYGHDFADFKEIGTFKPQIFYEIQCCIVL